jgi:hypothetical protein
MEAEKSKIIEGKSMEKMGMLEPLKKLSDFWQKNGGKKIRPGSPG